MKVSIVIPNYNGEKYLKICIDSLYVQEFKDFEIIFVDNGSKDNSCEVISQNYPLIKIIRLSENFGFSKAVNEGIKASVGEYVVLLNNDTEATVTWLENLVNCIEENKLIFSCCSKMLQYRDRSKIDDVGDEYNLLGWAYKRGDNSPVDKYCRDEEVFSSCAGAAIYRRRLFEEIGYFDEKFFAYMEDVDLSYRAKIFGYKNIYCSRAEIYHIGSATSGSKYNSFKVKLAAQNNVYVVLKNMPVLQKLLNSPFLLIGFFIKYLFFSSLGFSKEFKEGFKNAFKNKNEVARVEYKWKNFWNYIKIELKLIENTFIYVFSKIFK
jgi:GT2 family glycosyltransferase